MVTPFAEELLATILPRLQDSLHRKSFTYAFNRWHNLLGIDIRVHTNSQHIDSVLEEVISRFTKSTEPAVVATLELFLFSTKFALDKAIKPGIPTARLGFADWVLILSRDNCVAFLDLNARIAYVLIDSNVLEGPSDLDDFLLEVLFRFIAREEIGMIHGTGVYCEELAVLFVGPDGAGKSTMALALATLEKSPLIADTFIYFTRGAGALRLGGYSVHMIRLTPSALNLIECSLGTTYNKRVDYQALNWPERSKIPIRADQENHLHDLQNWIEPKRLAVFFPEFVNQGAELERISGEQALVRTLEVSVSYDSPMVLEKDIALHQSLLMSPNCVCYRLPLTGDILYDIQKVRAKLKYLS